MEQASALIGAGLHFGAWLFSIAGQALPVLPDYSMGGPIN